jgi:hypothetical protein
LRTKPLQKQLVAAYIVGMAIPKNFFSSLQMCEDPLQTAAFVVGELLEKDISPLCRSGKGNLIVTNPITWKTDNEYAPKK